ncbi:EamA family transporter [Streptomyces winkii]|uniref:EamA family transporter n=1 Tax=Streptomyces winkii TaxID=3051178 RepID=UPI0028D35B5E|nr:EamA family transporter [Streptomyces sp. DSM 40971]
MGALLALGSAVLYGLADFAGGLLSRRAAFALVALAGQAGGLALTLVAAPLLPAPAPAGSDLAWGALSGIGTGTGMVFLYRGMSRGAMSTVVPVSAVGGLALPVLAGVVLLGDRPSALSWLGILTAVPALWLVSRGGPARSASPRGTGASLDGLTAGAGIALQYAALAQAGPGTGIWPVTAGRLTAIAVILPAALPPLLRGMHRPATDRVGTERAGTGPADGMRLRLPPLRAAGAAATGMAAALALVLYLLATREQLVTVAVVLSSLYPAIPVLLGLTALRERPTPLQAAGLLGAATATGLLTAG